MVNHHLYNRNIVSAGCSKFVHVHTSIRLPLCSHRFIRLAHLGSDRLPGRSPWFPDRLKKRTRLHSGNTSSSPSDAVPSRSDYRTSRCLIQLYRSSEYIVILHGYFSIYSLIWDVHSSWESWGGGVVYRIQDILQIPTREASHAHFINFRRIRNLCVFWRGKQFLTFPTTIPRAIRRSHSLTPRLDVLVPCMPIIPVYNGLCPSAPSHKGIVRAHPFAAIP